LSVSFQCERTIPEGNPIRLYKLATRGPLRGGGPTRRTYERLRKGGRWVRGSASLCCFARRRYALGRRSGSLGDRACRGCGVRARARARALAQCPLLSVLTLLTLVKLLALLAPLATLVLVTVLVSLVLLAPLSLTTLSRMRVQLTMCKPSTRPSMMIMIGMLDNAC